MKAKKLVYGVGVNDADYKVNTIDESGKRVRCPIYTQWKNMMARCYAESTHKNQPTYRDCSVDPRWHSFMGFREWMLTQTYDGLHLDKDILFEGNKVYGPDTCVFVTRRVNSFFGDRIAARDLPKGVTRNGAKYQTSIDGGKTWYGFTTAEDAEKAYLRMKTNAAHVLASEQTDQRVAKAIIARYPL